MSLDRILQYGFEKVGQRNVEYPASDPLGAANLGLQKLLEVCQQFHLKHQAIRSDTRLTNEGKLAKSKEAGQEALDVIGKMAETSSFRSLQQQVENMREALNLEPEEYDPLLLQDIRRFLSQEDRLRRGSVVLKAAAQGEGSVLAAVKNSPSFMELCPEDSYNEALKAYAQVKKPELALNLQLYTEALTSFQLSLNEAVESIGEVSGVTDSSLRSRLQKVIKGELPIDHGKVVLSA